MASGGERVVVPAETDRPLPIPLVEFGGIWTHHPRSVLDLGLAHYSRPSEEKLLRWFGSERWEYVREAHVWSAISLNPGVLNGREYLGGVYVTRARP